MPTMTAAEAARALQELAPYAQELALEVEEIGEDRLRLRLPFAARLVQGAGMLCGQAIMAAADSAMLLAVANAVGGLRPMSSVGQSTNFLRPVTSGDVVLEATILRKGRQLVFGEVTFYGADGKGPVAHVTSTYALLPAATE